MKAVVAAFNQEKALVGAFSVITNLRMELFEALLPGHRDRARVDEVHHQAQLGKGHPLRVPQDDHLQQETVLLSLIIQKNIKRLLQKYLPGDLLVPCPPAAERSRRWPR